MTVENKILRADQLLRNAKIALHKADHPDQSFIGPPFEAALRSLKLADWHLTYALMYLDATPYIPPAETF